MNKRQAYEHWKELHLPWIKETYEQDGVPDRPARRESWNNMIDGLIRDGDVPERAGDWQHPRGLETTQ